MHKAYFLMIITSLFSQFTLSFALFLSLDLSSVFSTARRHHGSLSYLIKSGLKQKISHAKACVNKQHFEPLSACEGLVVLVRKTQLDWRRCDRLHEQSAVPRVPSRANRADG